MSAEIGTLVAIFVIGNIGGFFIGRETMRYRHSEGEANGELEGIHMMGEIWRQVEEKRAENEKIREALKDWP